MKNYIARVQYQSGKHSNLYYSEDVGEAETYEEAMEIAEAALSRFPVDCNPVAKVHTPSTYGMTPGECIRGERIDLT